MTKTYTVQRHVPKYLASSRLISWNGLCMTRQFVFPFLVCYQHA